jgi:hypothetical protein
MPDYYDLDTKPITFEQWIELGKEKLAARQAAPDWESTPEEDPTRIGSDHVGEAWVSTVWTGLDHNYFGGTPLIFETMIFGGDHDEWMCRYSTLEQARCGHARVVTALTEGGELE